MVLCKLSIRNVEGKSSQHEVSTKYSEMHVKTLSRIIKSRNEVAVLV